MKPTFTRLPFKLMTLAITLPALSAGCVPVTDGLLGGPSLSALSGPSSEETASPSWTTSLDDGFDRSALTRSTIRIPIAEVQHNPTYAGDPIGGDERVGRTGEDGAFPTIETATSVEVDARFVLKSAMIAPFIALGDLVISPVRMCIAPPWSILTSPDDGWHLLPLDAADAGSDAGDAPAPEPTEPTPENTAADVSKSNITDPSHPFERSADATHTNGVDQ